jgi:bifunctional non-homologous end joining protein LigD
VFIIQETLNVGGKTLELSNLDKLFWPEQGYTKGDLLKYYGRIAEWILPYIKNRPVVMKRYPDGIHGKNFYQKRCPEYAPKWMNTVDISNGKKILRYCVCSDAVSLLWLVNQGCIDIHTWLSQVTTLQNPDIMLIDLDPYPGVAFSQVIKVSLIIKVYLDQLNLVGFPKTSGATGLHIYIPIINNYSYEDVRKVAAFIADLVVSTHPDVATVERKVDLRKGKVYIDYLQNAYGKSIASVYSVRPYPLATVSTPLTWEELKNGKIHPHVFTIQNILVRLIQVGDLFKPVLEQPNELDKILSIIGKGTNLL